MTFGDDYIKQQNDVTVLTKMAHCCLFHVGWLHWKRCVEMCACYGTYRITALLMKETITGMAINIHVYTIFT